MARETPSRERVLHAHEVLRQCNGNRAEAARQLGMAQASLYNLFDIGLRAHNIPIPERKYGVTPDAKGRKEIDITDGVVYVGSDAHYWPGEPSTAHKAFCKFIKREKNLTAVVMNGDAYDFPNISRHDSDWFQTPSVKEELEVVEERLSEIIKASGKAKRFFTRGNHDVRWDRYLAKNAPEMRGISGMCIEDRNPLWTACWSLFINNRPGGCVVKHRYKGGIHATYNNSVMSGRSMVTGHLHAQRVTPVSDYNGTRWGVDTGCLQDPWSPAFSYLEDNPRPWVSGFARLKFVGGNMLTPELVRVVEANVVEWRGELITVE